MPTSHTLDHRSFICLKISRIHLLQGWLFTRLNKNWTKFEAQTGITLTRVLVGILVSYTIDWVALTKQSYCSQLWRLGSLRLRCQLIRFLVRASSWFSEGHLFAVYSHIRERRSKLSYISSYKGTNPIMRASYSWPTYLLKALLPNTITLGIIKLWILGEHKQLVYSSGQHVICCWKDGFTRNHPEK